MQSLHESLNKYSKSGILPLHMPGHKRRSDLLPDWNPWELDFTEVSGLDNLYEAEGIIKDALERLAASYGVKQSFFLVNGSTGGLLTAIAACVEHGDTILMARNCHKAVYNAAYLNRLRCNYIYPELLTEWNIPGGIEPEAVRRALEEDRSVKAVVITSPTYEGIVSDVEAIAKVVHEYNIPLIVDEAHGAHFRFMESCPRSAVDCGADIVVQSFHKLLPALTQTAVLHVVDDKLVDIDRLKMYYSMYQTSSPSYLLMASIDYACGFMTSPEGKLLEKEYTVALKETKEAFKTFGNIVIMQNDIINRAAVYDLDPTKLLISTRNGAISGALLEEMLLKDYNIQVEMSKGNNVLLMTSVAESEETLKKVVEAFADIDKQCALCLAKRARFEPEYRAVVRLTSYEAINAKTKSVSIEDAKGMISAEYVYIYPPGVPVLVPGELITEEMLDILCYYRDEYGENADGEPRRLQGLKDKTTQNILIVDN